MATLSCLCSLNLKTCCMARGEPIRQNFVFQPTCLVQSKTKATQISAPSKNPIVLTAAGAGILAGTGLALAATMAADPASAAAELQGQLTEPANALSLPTWAVHVSSVVEWIIAMTLVWQYGEVSGYQTWKGLSWGMVPLLGGAFCACTWHFFYNSESLEVLVALQAALTVIGNGTMCFAAYRIYKSAEEEEKGSKSM